MIAHWKVSVGSGVFQVAVGISVLMVQACGLAAVLVALAGWLLVFGVESCRLRKQTEKK
ncbi:MAG: hypothetical protein WCR46_02635 [Deltaproteobacteria bacterium]